MAAPVFQLADFGDSASGTITRQKDMGVTLRVDVDDVSFDYGTGGGWDRTAIVWYWDDDAAPEWKYNVHLGGWVSGHSWDTVGTKTMWCALVNGNSRFSVVTAVNMGGDVVLAVDAAVAAGEATKVSRTINVVDTLTEIHYDFVNGDNANDGSAENPKKSLPDDTFGMDGTRHIVLEDEERTTQLTLRGNDTVIDLRNSASVIWVGTPDRLISISGNKVAIKRDTQNGFAFRHDILDGGTPTSISSSNSRGITLENISFEGAINGLILAKSAPEGERTGDFLFYKVSLNDMILGQCFWIGNERTDIHNDIISPYDPVNTRHYVNFAPKSIYGSSNENQVRGWGRFVTIIDPELRQGFVPGKDLNWREDGHWLFGEGLADVIINTRLLVQINAGTGITPGTYVATAVGTDPISGQPALKLLTSPSTASTDLLSNDIQLYPLGRKSPVRIYANQYFWLRGGEVSQPIWPHGQDQGTVIAHAPIGGSDSFPELRKSEFTVVERVKTKSGGLYTNNLSGGANRTLFRACVADNAVTNSQGHVQAELGSLQDKVLSNRFAIGANAIRHNSDELSIVNCTHKVKSVYSNFFMVQGQTNVDIINCLEVNPSREVLTDQVSREHAAIQADADDRVLDEVFQAKWDESTMQIYWGTLETEGPNFNENYPPLTNPGVKIDITSGTGVTLGKYIVSAPSTHADSGQRALTLETSPSASNVDLTTGDITYHVVNPGLWLLRAIKNNQFSPFAVDPGGFKQSGNKIFLVEDINDSGSINQTDSEDLTAFNIRVFADGNVVQLAELPADYYPTSNVISAPPDPRCFEDYYGNPMDGATEVVGAVSQAQPAPVLTNPTATAESSSSISATVDTDTATGTLYRYASTSASAPSVADLKNGTGAAASDSKTVTATGTQTFVADLTGLASNTLYYIYMLQDDGSGNDSSIVSASATTDSAASSSVLFFAIMEVGPI